MSERSQQNNSLTVDQRSRPGSISIIEISDRQRMMCPQQLARLSRAAFPGVPEII